MLATELRSGPKVWGTELTTTVFTVAVARASTTIVAALKIS